ncbi:universal stress protein in QAH/OAS sulfhydrylase 3'region-like [Biomphalaria glabrata]|uniref:Universal stress protein in QAH/OAS sulfhydrylase 3'region-like n=1 Tax=Biomphalaria glabrata TaxID=6526 RepID=A0A9W3A4F3_BIOGL|nr:universal stress protein in QAH/OAS sulfhydrylase 3'region-like [Biomphalaria glabrata]
MAESGAHRVVALAIDESEHSDNAFHWYCEHIYKEGDYLLLIHVPETYDFTMASPAVVEQLLKELEERVDNLEKKYREKLLARRISGKFRTASGKPGEKIVSVARDERATLIITGTRGLGKFRRTILGSVSDYIVHHSNVPVLVCRWKSPEDTKS